MGGEISERFQRSVRLFERLVQVNPHKKEDIRIVSYASRSLTDTERRYSHIEKEALAMVWACEKFYVYLYGQRFTIVTDNKALVYIFARNEDKKIPSRIENWVLRIRRFDFVVRHQPGIGNPADYLSRQPLATVNEIDSAEHYINYVFTQSVPKSIKKEEIIKAAQEDDVMKELVRRIRGSKFNRPISSEFNSILGELSVTNEDVVMRGKVIVLPSVLRRRVIEIAHESHQGITKTKSLLKTKVWFPGIDRMVLEKLSSCKTCQLNSPTTH